MTDRRKFLVQAMGLGAAVGSLTSTSSNSAVGQLPEFMLSERTKELLSRYEMEVPILQAPVGFSSGPDLVIAVGKAGGLGSMALTRATPEDASARVRKVREAISVPFVVNYILAAKFDSLPAALEAGAPIVQFSWGIPSPDMVSLIRLAGARFGVQVGSANGARRAFDSGADYVVCQGVEAGGHVQGAAPLMEALPGVLAVAKGRPVFAAGGIATGKGIRKVLDAGASGAMLGTRFVATQESYAHRLYKEALVRAESEDAVFTVCFDGGWSNATHRSLRNATYVAWEAAGCPPSGMRPGEGDILARRPDGSPVLRYAGASPSKSLVGDGILDCSLHAGLGVGQIRDIPKVEELVKRLWADCQSRSA